MKGITKSIPKDKVPDVVKEELLSLGLDSNVLDINYSLVGLISGNKEEIF